jgi:transposase-like protein
VGDSWRADETYVKVKGQWNYLYHAVDSTGKTIDFILIENRDMKAAKRFFQKALSSDHVQTPTVFHKIGKGRQKIIRLPSLLLNGPIKYLVFRYN